MSSFYNFIWWWKWTWEAPLATDANSDVSNFTILFMLGKLTLVLTRWFHNSQRRLRGATWEQPAVHRFSQRVESKRDSPSFFRKATYGDRVKASSCERYNHSLSDSQVSLLHWFHLVCQLNDKINDVAHVVSSLEYSLSGLPCSYIGDGSRGARGARAPPQPGRAGGHWVSGQSERQ